MNSAEIIAFDIRCNIIFYGEHLDRSTIGNYEQRWINTINHRGYDYLYAGKNWLRCTINIAYIIFCQKFATTLSWYISEFR